MSDVKSTLSPPSKTNNTTALFQPYFSYAWQQYLSFFGSLGFTYTSGKTTQLTVPSNAHNLTLTYFGTGGALFILPTIKDVALPTLRVSSTYFTSKTDSYYWNSTYYGAVRSHMTTIDPALRLTFIAIKGSIPYIEYGLHWIANRSPSISQEPKRMGQTFIIGSTILFEDDYQLSLNYIRDNLTTPGYRDSVMVRLAYSF